jgi:inward rectifier potassium channel
MSVRNVERIGLRRRYWTDLYHFLLNLGWLRLVGVIVLLYVLINVMFASVYVAADDAIENARPGSFRDAFFFSVQTMATIGYGKMVPRTLFADVMVTVEALTGMLYVTMVTGLLFAKFSRPTARVMFSRWAVITRREGVDSLMFRMANVRSNQIVEAQLRLVLARDERTAEGEAVRRFYDLKLVRERNAFFMLTWTAVHPLTADSPLHGCDAAKLKEQHAEIIASVMGLDDTFSQTVHARHSYTPDALVWGSRLVDILHRREDGRAVVDYTKFHDVQPA